MTLKEWIEENKDKVITITENGAIELNDPKPEKPGRRKPKRGDIYWVIYGDGDPSAMEWKDGMYDQAHYLIGNVFKNEPEAKSAVERMKIRAELLDCGGKEAREVILPVGNIYKYRYAIAINSNHSAVNYPTTSLKIRAELLDCGGKEAREVILPVGNIYKYRYAIAINSNHSAVNYPTTSPRPFEITFETEAEVEAAIEKVGEDRIKKYLFGAINSNHSAVNYPTTSPRPFEITFETEAEVEAAIEKVGEDRIKKYLFGIED